MSYSLYGSFTIEEAADVGAHYGVKCKGNRGYEHVLTTDKIYSVEVTARILPMSPLCKGIGDEGQPFQCHLERFEKVS